MPLLPVYMAKAGGFFFLVFGVISVIAATVTVNPIWALGPYRPDQVSTNAQPDWYMGFSEGLIRIMPGWEIHLWGHTLVLGVFIPLMVFPLVLAAIAVYPFIESWVTGDKREHHIADRPRNAPTRTAFGAAWISWYTVMLIGGGNDLVATHFDLSINAITWFVRIALLRGAGRRLHRHPADLSRPSAPRQGEGAARPGVRHHQAAAARRVHRGARAAPAGAAAHAHRARAARAVRDRPRDRRERRRAQGRPRTQKLRARLSQGYYGEHSQIPKPTAEEYREITSGHGHH